MELDKQITETVKKIQTHLEGLEEAIRELLKISIRVGELEKQIHNQNKNHGN